MHRVALAALTAALLLGADQPKAPVAANPVVSISGKITRVDASLPGEGMPRLVVDVDGTSTSVILGSMRYLMEQDFKPKAGAQVQMKGYKLPASVITIEVRLPDANVTLRLRDENGWPLWRGGGCSRCGGSK
jgi:hypothetical protein